MSEYTIRKARELVAALNEEEALFAKNSAKWATVPSPANEGTASKEQDDRILAYAKKQLPVTDDGIALLCLAEQLAAARHQAEQLEATVAEQAKRISEQREQITALLALRDKNYWIWQGDETDHLESLGCHIIIHANQLRAQLSSADGERKRLEQYDREKWDFDSLADLYNEGGAPLIDFIITHTLSVFNKALGGKGWTAYESDGGLDDAIDYEINSLLEKNHAIDEWDHRPFGPLLLDLIRLSDNESKKGKFRVTLDYDNYQDGGRVLDGDENIIGECYESREGNADEDGPNSQIVGAIIAAVDAAMSTPPTTKEGKGEAS